MMLQGTSQSRGHGTGQGMGTRRGRRLCQSRKFFQSIWKRMPVTVLPLWPRGRLGKTSGEGGKLPSPCLHAGTQSDWVTQAAPTGGEQDSLWVQSRAFPRAVLPHPVQGGWR